MGDALTAHPSVVLVAFTGGEETGRAICQPDAKGLKPAVMELGGKSANIVMDDPDLDEAVDGAIAGIFAASGQTCIAGSRLLVQRNIHDEFLDRLVRKAQPAVLGNPVDTATQVGPVTTRPKRDEVSDHSGIGRAEGAEVVLGGSCAVVAGSHSGLFVQPSIFASAGNSMRIAREEVFGPILSVIPFADPDEAVAIANDSQHGLAAGLWTADMRRAFRMSEDLHAGTVWVNTYRAVSFLAPFGGVKRSGFGRENARHTIDEFLDTKSVRFLPAIARLTRSQYDKCRFAQEQ